jgi:hypothetical protein
MSIQVEIEGRSPNSVIEVGERRTVTRTAYINTLVRNGFVKIVGLVPGKKPEPAPEATPDEPTPSSDEVGEIAAPAESATKAVWQSFLTERGVDYTTNDTKAALIERWNAARP